ncbi:MAG: hypothetical protein U9N85_08285 [Bacteroidota bacterium]|nr:hypothetical protein [Bacteroidota bacterium]
MRVFIIILLVSISFFGKAQDYEVAPTQLIYRVNPGDSEEKIVTVTNHASVKQSFSFVFADYTIDIHGNKHMMEKNSTRFSCAAWMQPEMNFIVLNPNESRAIKIKMDVPNDDLSTRWATLYLQTSQEQTTFNADKSSVSAGVSVGTRISIQVFRFPINIPDPVINISRLKQADHSVGEEREFTALVENTGVSLENCKITFVTLNLKTAEKKAFKPIVVDVYPGFPRLVRFQLPESLPSGEYALSAILDYGDKNVLEGTRMKTKLIVDKTNE